MEGTTAAGLADALHGDVDPVDTELAVVATNAGTGTGAVGTVGDHLPVDHVEVEDG